jgi:hypothetical protein
LSAKDVGVKTYPSRWLIWKKLVDAIAARLNRLRKEVELVGKSAKSRPQGLKPEIIYCACGSQG